MTRPTSSKPARLRASTKTPRASAAKVVGTRMPRARNAQPLPEAQPPSVADTTDGLEGAMAALSLALEKKALEPVLLDVRRLCSFCNYQLIVSGRSDRQVDAISDGIAAGLREHGLSSLGKEGSKTGNWSLLDYGDFVVHVFVHSARETYDLEGLWNDAPRIAIEVPDDAKLRTAETYS